ncbi:MAG: energy transducer TonB [Pseudomonadota bacterium]
MLLPLLAAFGPAPAADAHRAAPSAAAQGATECIPFSKRSAGDDSKGPWVRNSDYPREALRNNQEGNVEFTLTVDAEGCVTTCVVTRSSGYPILDETTCALLRRRARFNPAEDKDGHRIAATWQSVFHWQLPQ